MSCRNLRLFFIVFFVFFLWEWHGLIITHSHAKMCSGKSLYDYNEEGFVEVGKIDAISAMNIVPLQERKRKKNYNESDYYREQMNENSRSSAPRVAKPKSIQVLVLFFFYLLVM